MAGDDRTPVVPDRAALTRVYRATEYVERLSRNALKRRGRGAPGEDIRSATVTTAITPFAGTTFGKGRVDLYHKEGDQRVKDSPAVNVEVYSDFSATVAVGARVLVCVISGEWSLVSADCP
jgi:hypothetical protein